MATSLLDTIKRTVLIPPHPAGIPFIGGGIIAALIFFMFSEILGMIALVFAAFCLFFFRDPDRVTPQKSSLVIAGADGLVSSIVHDLPLPPELGNDDGARYTRISTFLSVIDVHVNRSPVSGKILRKVYTPGKFLNADLDKASEDNERCAMLMETPSGQKVGVVQIAGLIARRILNDAREDQSFVAGGRYGIIRFGSRVDVYVPEGISPLVCIGQRTVGGETVLADFESDEAAREGHVVA